MAYYDESDIKRFIGIKGGGAYPILKKGAKPVDTEPNKDRQIAESKEQAGRQADEDNYKEFQHDVNWVEQRFKEITGMQQPKERRAALRELGRKIKNLQERLDLQKQKVQGLVGSDRDNKILSEYSTRLTQILLTIEYLTDKDNR